MNNSAYPPPEKFFWGEPFRCERESECHVRNPEELVCHTCNKSFSSISYLTVHIRSHTGGKPYTCHLCNKSFSRKNNLSRHKWTHAEQKPHVCRICNKSFRSKPYLTVHIRSHIGGKSYTCNVCNRSFSHKSNLSRHKWIHAEEKPHVCHICGRGYIQKAEIKEHFQHCVRINNIATKEMLLPSKNVAIGGAAASYMIGQSIHHAGTRRSDPCTSSVLEGNCEPNDKKEPLGVEDNSLFHCRQSITEVERHLPATLAGRIKDYRSGNVSELTPTVALKKSGDLNLPSNRLAQRDRTHSLLSNYRDPLFSDPLPTGTGNMTTETSRNIPEELNTVGYDSLSFRHSAPFDGVIELSPFPMSHSNEASQEFGNSGPFSHSLLIAEYTS